MRYLAFCGPSDSGKTWMVERLVSRWTRHGLRIGLLKHCSKGYDLDKEGKDSARFWKAGSAVVGVIGPREWAVRRREDTADPMRVIQTSFPSDLDVVVLEGFRDVAMPRIRVFGDLEPQVCTPLDADTVACVARTPTAALQLPIFALTDDEGLSSFLIQKCGIRSEMQLVAKPG